MVSSPNFAFSPPLGAHLPAPFAVKAHPDADARLNADFFGRANRLFELFQFLDHDDDTFAEFAAEQRDADVGGVLVAVANDQAFRVLVHGQRRDQFRFAAGLETKMKLLAGIDNFFDYLTQLIHLDRENAAILAAVIELLNRVSKRAIDRFDPVTKQILEANDQRKTEAAGPRFVYDFEDVDRSTGLLQGHRLHIASIVDGEIAGAPAVDVVGADRGLNVPLVFYFFGGRHWKGTHNQSVLGTCKHWSRKFHAMVRDPPPCFSSSDG